MQVSVAPSPHASDLVAGPFNPERFMHVTQDDVVQGTGCVAEIVSAQGRGPGFAAFVMDVSQLLAVMHRSETRERVRELVKRTGTVIKVAETTWDQLDTDEERYSNTAIDSAMINAATISPDIAYVPEGTSRFIKFRSGISFGEDDLEWNNGGTIRGGQLGFSVAGFRTYRENREAAQMIALTSATISYSRRQHLE